MLERAGLTERRRRRRPAAKGGRLYSGQRGQAPNEVWTVDFKGWWYSQARERCEPLPVGDEYTRYILELRAVENARSSSPPDREERRIFHAQGGPSSLFSRPRHVSALRSLREPDSPGACASCGSYDACRGGCMAAKFFTGLPLDGPDPECVHGHGEAALLQASRPLVDAGHSHRGGVFVPLTRRI